MRQQQSDITIDISLDDGYELFGRKLEVFGQPLHNTTRFSLFIPCLTKPEFANLNGFLKRL
jgi:hypothetical protein